MKTGEKNGATTTTTDNQGYYSISIPYGWSGTITPAKVGYEFTPISETYSNVISDLTDQNFDANQPILIEDFNDNKQSASWIINNPYAPISNMNETNQHLEFTSTQDIDQSEAYYSANCWLLDSTDSFGIKADFHNSNITTNPSGIPPSTRSSKPGIPVVLIK